MSIDILPSESDLPAADAKPGRPSPLRLVLSGLVVVLVLALVGGVTVAVRGLSGGGSQPEDVLPAGAFAFAKIDLDPPAGQKINALRFLRKFPALRDKVSLDADLREALFEAVADSAGWGELDFDSDVSPWLGQRVAVAAYAPTGAGAGAEPLGGPLPTVVVALQVSDAGKARTGLDRLIAATPGAPDPGVVIQDGFALLAPDQETADEAARDAAAGVLADDENFRSDLEALGDGVASAWVDMDGVSSVAGLGLTGLAGVGSFGVGGLNPAGAGGGGRTSYVLRFDGADALEVRGAVTGSTGVVGPDQPLRGFTDLPKDSTVAFGLAGGDGMVPGIFDGLRKVLDDQAAGGPAGGFDAMVADAERELGIELPDDLAVLLGSNLVGALHQGSLAEGELELGARVTTDGPRAVSVLDKIATAARAHGEDFPIVRRLTDDGVIVASSRAQVDRLAATGRLGDRDAVRKAMPDLDQATAALWVDVRALVGEFFGDPVVNENLEPVEGIGMTVQMRGDGAASYRLRLVVN